MTALETAVHSIPATIANLGPGFDCLGVALKLYNLVTVNRARTPAADPMAAVAANRFFEASGKSPFGFSWSIKGDVPSSRGLGSSVTVRLGILHGLNALSGKPLGHREIFALCAELEGHPDNAAPGAFGGFTVASSDFLVKRFAVTSKLKFVLLIPDFEVKTADARKVMPAEIPHRDAVLSTMNACRITAAFASNDFSDLRGAFADYLHQTYRLPLVPMLPDVIAAAEGAGAIGGFLSGSGSTIGCITLEKPKRVADAMQEAARLKNVRMVITTVDNRGAMSA